MVEGGGGELEIGRQTGVHACMHACLLRCSGYDTGEF